MSTSCPLDFSSASKTVDRCAKTATPLVQGRQRYIVTKYNVYTQCQKVLSTSHFPHLCWYEPQPSSYDHYPCRQCGPWTTLIFLYCLFFFFGFLVFWFFSFVPCPEPTSIRPNTGSFLGYLFRPRVTSPSQVHVLLWTHPPPAKLISRRT